MLFVSESQFMGYYRNVVNQVVVDGENFSIEQFESTDSKSITVLELRPGIIIPQMIVYGA